MRLGTRGSLLAMAQANTVSALLEPLFGSIEVCPIRTSGDAGNRERLGAFVSEIEEALLDNRVDLALHCLKDIPTQVVPGLRVVAYLPREDPRDAILTAGISFAELKDGAIVGTGSLRRTSQLTALNPTFQFKPLLGNVDTRLRKLLSGEYDAIVLAIAGLNRLGLENPASDQRYASIQVQPLDLANMLPSAGQATLVIQARAEDEAVNPLVKFNDRATETCSIAERAFLARFGGGCSVPVAAHALPSDDRFILHGLIASPKGDRIFRGWREFDPENAALCGRHLAEDLGIQGGFQILEDLKSGGGR